MVTSFDEEDISQLKTLLHSTFHMKDLGRLNYFLGLEVHYAPTSIFVNQHKYIDDLIALASLTKSTFRRDEGDLLEDPTFYRKLVGSLIYLS